MTKPCAVFCLCMLLSLGFDVFGQKQLVILKKEKVIFRAYPGDEIVFSLKTDPKEQINSYVNNLFDTALVIHQDVIAFHRIDRIYFKKRGLLSDAGAKFVVAGIGLFLLDQFNTVVVQGEDASISKNVAITSAALVGAGVIMIATKKNYQKIGGKYRLLVVEKGSVFYRPDMRQDLSE